MKILALRTEGIGNGIESSPTYMSIKKNIKDVMLDVWVDPRAYDLFVGHSHIDHLFKWPKIPTNGPYDYGLCLVFDGGLMTEAARKICNKIIKHPNVDFIRKSETQLNLEIAQQIGGWDGKYYPASIYISEPDQNFAKELIKDFHKPVISLAIGCESVISPVHKKRLWNLGGWTKTIKLLQDKYNPTILILGHKNEERDAKELCGRLPSWYNIHNLVCKTTIKQTAAIIKECDLLVCLDCGLMHIAAAVGTNFVSLWGPTSEVKSQPWTSKEKYAIVRDESLNCKRCYTYNPGLFQKCTNQICMKNITAEQIMQAIEEKKFL